jgi:hypothetical protein
MFGADAIWVSHYIRWLFFLSENECREVLLSAIRHFCDLFSSSECIVTRDEHPATVAFRAGASFSDALCAAADANEGEVKHIEDLYIDMGVSNDLCYVSDGEEIGIGTWDSVGYWRLVR